MDNESHVVTWTIEAGDYRGTGVATEPGATLAWNVAHVRAMAEVGWTAFVYGEARVRVEGIGRLSEYTVTVNRN